MAKLSPTVGAFGNGAIRPIVPQSGCLNTLFDSACALNKAAYAAAGSTVGGPSSNLLATAIKPAKHKSQEMKLPDKPLPSPDSLPPL